MFFASNKMYFFNKIYFELTVFNYQQLECCLLLTFYFADLAFLCPYVYDICHFLNLSTVYFKLGKTLPFYITLINLPFKENEIIMGN